MGIYRVYATEDGESHIEELELAEHPELHSMLNVGEVRVQWWTEPRVMGLSSPAGPAVDHTPER